MDIKWVKLDVSMFSNRKIRQIRTLPEGDSTVVIWLQLLCLAGSVNDGGRVYFTEDIPYTERMLAKALEEPEELVKKALRLFQAYGMIERDGDMITIANWEKYQDVEGMDKVRAQTRKRVAKYRESKKNDENAICNVTSSVTVTQCNGVDIEEDIDKEKYIPKGMYKEKVDTKRFVKPSITDIDAYCKEKGYETDTESFFNYYESKGWIVGKAPMKDWKAAIRNWVKNDKNWHRKRNIPDYSFEEMKNAPEVDIKDVRTKLFGGTL